MGMYDNKKYMGKTLVEWQKLMHNRYSLGELYQMAKDKQDFVKIANIAE